MEAIGITLINNASYSIGLTLVVSSMVDAPHKHNLCFAVILFITQILRVPIQYDTFLLTPCVLTFLYRRYSGNLRRAFYYSFTSVFVLWYPTAMIGSAVLFLSPSWHGTPGFNYVMCAFILTPGIIAKTVPKTVAWCRKLKFESYMILLEMGVFVCYSFILQRHFRVETMEEKRQFAVITFMFLFLITVICLSAVRMVNLELKDDKTAALLKVETGYREQTEQQYQKIMELKHWYRSLYTSMYPHIDKGDIEGLRLFFHKYIEPEHEKLLHADQLEQLKSIHDDLLKNLIANSLEKIMSVAPNIYIDLLVIGQVTLPDSILMDIYRMLSMLFDNATLAVQGQINGMIRLHIFDYGDSCSFQISNTVLEKVDISKFSQTPAKGDSNGYGLNIVRSIVSAERYEFFTYVDGRYNQMEIITQKLNIDLLG